MSKELLKRDFTDIFPSFFNEGAKWLRGFNSEFDKILNGKCDFEDRDNEYYIELETPGVEKNEININFKNDNLVVNWSRTREEKKGKSDKSRYERSSGSFQKNFNKPPLGWVNPFFPTFGLKILSSSYAAIFLGPSEAIQRFFHLFPQ